MEHTKEPWVLIESTPWSESQITSKDGLYQIAFDLPERNARRIVACVNACADMNDPEMEIEKLKKDRSELLETLKTGEATDGYHTFNELYEYRMVYNALLFNEWSKKGLYDVHKSMRHSSGEECFGGGWFIVMAELPTGQISNHYELKYWNMFICNEKKANEYDGHTPQEVVGRMKDLIKRMEERDGPGKDIR